MLKKRNLSLLTLGLLLGMSLINTPSQAREDGACKCNMRRVYVEELDTKAKCEENHCYWEQAQNF